MISAYPACFFKDSSGYYVVFPDLRYLATCAPSLEEGLSAAIDCLAGYLFSCRQKGETVPEPTPMQNLRPDEIAGELEMQAADGFVNMIAVDVDEYARVHFERSVKKTLTIPVWMNKAALKRGLNFSQVLQEALTERLRS
ncbi:MAG: type II toxin-antitoxin system HicB family antitoxin [Clostridia bacterium]|nr:type II toxin-antitoxin system HicB family antitoxin [Clostridia bacterium]